MSNKTNLKKIKNRRYLINTKSKRSNLIVKKCHELSQLCDLTINLVIYDPRTNKLVEFKTDFDFVVEDKKKEI